MMIQIIDVHVKISDNKTNKTKYNYKEIFKLNKDYGFTGIYVNHLFQNC